jgi:type I restriction enzyme M protein
MARYFADKRNSIEQLQADLDAVTQELEGLIEEHTGEDGVLVDAQSDTGKATKTNLKKLIKENQQFSIFDEEDSSVDAEQVAVLEQCLELFDLEAEKKKAVKEATDALDKAVFAQYPKLTEEEIKGLVVDDKWQATLEGAISAEIERVTQQLPQLVDEVEALSSKVDEHLRRMGLEWN